MAANDYNGLGLSGSVSDSSNTGTKQSNLNNYKAASSDVWISGMRIAAWLMFIGIIIAGIVVAVFTRHIGIGLLIILGSAIVAFFTVAGIMIYLNLADNVLQIRRLLEKG